MLRSEGGFSNGDSATTAGGCKGGRAVDDRSGSDTTLVAGSGELAGFAMVGTEGILDECSSMASSFRV